MFLASDMKMSYSVEKRSEPMAFVISDACTACGTCIDSCPVEAIGEGDPIYTIDADACVDCAQCQDVCPVEAISPQ